MRQLCRVKVSHANAVEGGHIMEHEVADSREAWEANAVFWDAAMGDASNAFHRQTVRPGVTDLLDPQPGDFVLDVACGNGNYAAYLAERGVDVLAFDFSPRMIELARCRQERYADRIEFVVADATDADSLRSLARARPFTKAVSKMAIMDIAAIDSLFDAVHRLLVEDGIFVFATQHPCFVTRTERYSTPHSYRGEAIPGQSQEHLYFHRSLQDIFEACFTHGFVIDGFRESCFAAEREIPAVIIVRARKVASERRLR